MNEKNKLCYRLNIFLILSQIHLAITALSSKTNLLIMYKYSTINYYLFCLCQLCIVTNYHWLLIRDFILLKYNYVAKIYNRLIYLLSYKFVQKSILSDICSVKDPVCSPKYDRLYLPQIDCTNNQLCQMIKYLTLEHSFL